jgi:hypothetical protein
MPRVPVIAAAEAGGAADNDGIPSKTASCAAAPPPIGSGRCAVKSVRDVENRCPSKVRTMEPSNDR